ncbi:MAG: hypothetical protein ACLFVD_04315 [Dehalococcoidia bacterium]
MCHYSDCSCEHHSHHPPPVEYHHAGQCCGTGHAAQGIPAREETVEEIEGRLKHLSTEIGRLEKRIAELKTGGQSQ